MTIKKEKINSGFTPLEILKKAFSIVGGSRRRIRFLPNLNHQRKAESLTGFTLLFAVLIASIVFGVSIGFSFFIIRELRVSIIGRESQKAFFASDGGVECAIYWDLKNNSFSTSTTSVIDCAGSSPTVGGSSGISDFTLNFTNGACVSVRVDKNFYPETRIYSYGHNTCDISNPNRVERALKIRY